MLKYYIRPARSDEWETAMSLAWLVFNKYEASEYGREGTESFLNFISDNVLYKMFLAHEYRLFVAVTDSEIIGLISLRNKSHISLLFVDEKYHKRGIGRALIDYVKMFLAEEERLGSCTVNAAPYAVDFYHKVGFADTAGVQVSEGIKYTPMRIVF